MRTKFIYLVVIVFFTGCEKNAEDVNIPSQTESSEKETYVPQNLDDCFSELKKMLSPEVVEDMKNGSEEEMIKYHFSLGMWMRNNWGLWKGSRLSEWFNQRGIHHPDDMSGIILTSFWRHLNGQPVKLEEQINFYQQYWKPLPAK